MATSTKEYQKLGKCQSCNYWDFYTYRSDYGYLASCNICGTSLNKEVTA